MNFRRKINIPEDWKMYSLNDTKLNESNSFVDGPFGSCLKTSDYTESGIPVIQLNNIGINEFIHNKMNFTSKEKFEELERAQSFPGDIIIAKMAHPVARCCILENDIPQLVISADCIKLKVNQNFSSKFLLHMINSTLIMNITSSFATGTTRLRINLSELKKVLFPCPPSKIEQESISQILDNINEFIKKQEEKIHQIQELKKGQMQKLLTKGIKKRKTKKVEGLFCQDENIPEDWDYLPLEKLGLNDKTAIRMGPFGSNLKKEELVKDGILTLWIENIVNNEFELDYKQYITEKKFQELKGFQVKPDDVLITMMGTIGRVAIVPKNIGKAIITSHLLKISLNQSKCLPEYLYYFLQSNFIFRQTLRESRGVVMGGLNTKIIKSLWIKVPPIPEQEAIISILSNLDNLLKHEKKIKGKVIDIKKGLEQNLLTGKIRVTI
jgi:type I restriction enzyme, S subunit